MIASTTKHVLPHAQAKLNPNNSCDATPGSPSLAELSNAT
jgi:hypothetical protein